MAARLAMITLIIYLIQKIIEKTKKSSWFYLLSNILNFLFFYFLIRRMVRFGVEKVKLILF
jgi:hypothetical protein